MPHRSRSLTSSRRSPTRASNAASSIPWRRCSRWWPPPCFAVPAVWRPSPTGGSTTTTSPRPWAWAQGVTDLDQRLVAIDGKTLRGSQGHQLPGVHLLAAYCRDVEAVIAQLAVPGKTNERKTALQLLKLIPLEGTPITGDAAFAQRDLCEAVVRGRGDYFLTVKDN